MTACGVAIYGILRLRGVSFVRYSSACSYCLFALSIGMGSFGILDSSLFLLSHQVYIPLLGVRIVIRILSPLARTSAILYSASSGAI